MVATQDLIALSERNTTDNKCICAIGADEYCVSSFGPLLSFLSQLDFYF